MRRRVSVSAGSLCETLRVALVDLSGQLRASVKNRYLETRLVRGFTESLTDPAL